MLRALELKFQSTRPQGARRARRYNSVPFALSFNPRARRGRDRGGFPSGSRNRSFNPRARRGRDFGFSMQASFNRVSIHAPAGGATHPNPNSLNINRPNHYFRYPALSANYQRKEKWPITHKARTCAGPGYSLTYRVFNEHYRLAFRKSSHPGIHQALVSHRDARFDFSNSYQAYKTASCLSHHCTNSEVGPEK